MECPKCGSSQVERLPPSQISPKPGYRCNDCGSKLRSPGMYVVYLAILLIGLTCVVGSIFAMVTLDGTDRPFRVLWLAGAGAVVAGYSAMQLARPAPLNRRVEDPAEESDDD